MDCLELPLDSIITRKGRVRFWDANANLGGFIPQQDRDQDSLALSTASLNDKLSFVTYLILYASFKDRPTAPNVKKILGPWFDRHVQFWGLQQSTVGLPKCKWHQNLIFVSIQRQLRKGLSYCLHLSLWTICTQISCMHLHACMYMHRYVRMHTHNCLFYYHSTCFSNMFQLKLAWSLPRAT